jgi:Glycoside Hydrolase Family 113
MKLQKVRNIILWLLATLLAILVITSVVIYFKGVPLNEVLQFWPSMIETLVTSPLAWLILATPYFLSRLVKFLIQSYKNRGTTVFLKRFSLSVVFPAFSIFAFSHFSKSYTQSENFVFEWDHAVENVNDTIANRYGIDGKQRGMHLFWRRNMSQEQINQLLKNNIEWITIVPYGGQKDYDSNSVGRRGQDYSGWSRRDSSFMKCIQLLKTKGIHVMMKPHIWMHSSSSGKWRSDISHSNEEDWEKWSQSYTDFILHYAKLSELLGVEILCMGTELHQTIIEHPNFWIQLIPKIRKIYSSKITYAANWNKEVVDVPFWNELDFIGIQAYYPLTKKNEPSVKELVKGWKTHVQRIEQIQKKYNKPILFTEIGYKSTVDAAIEPWQWADGLSGYYKKVSTKTQANCYEAFFRTFWDKDWFAGVHFWQWQARHEPSKGQGSINFTPQQKPAENIMAKWFGKFGN